MIAEPCTVKAVKSLEAHVLEWIEKAKNGDREAYGELYGLLWQDLYKTAYYTLGNSNDAEDAVAETFLEGFKGIRDLRSPEAFRSWMFKILSARCKRKIKTYYTARSSVSFDDLETTGMSIASHDADTDEIVQLQTALSRLSPQERQITVLFSVEGYKIAEIAEMLDLPQGTVSSKIHRTLKKLRTYMEER